MDKTQPRVLTSYDLLKSLAVVIMIVDHVGAYFYPDHLMYRAVGRTGFPVWFFLVGYARGRDISPRLFFGGIVLLLANIAAGMPLLPLNALFTIMAIRVLLDRYAARSFTGIGDLAAACAVLAILVFPTSLLTEYGTQALITAMFGYVARHQPALRSTGRGRDAVLWFFAAFTFVSFVAGQQLMFGFPPAPFIVMASGTALCVAVLLAFRPVTYAAASARVPGALLWLLRAGGRRTLEIYVVHLTLFKIAAACLHPDKYHWFRFILMAGGA